MLLPQGHWGVREHAPHPEVPAISGSDRCNTPGDLGLRLVLDNYAIHRPPAGESWMTKHPRYHVHFTPISDSWLNPFERWFVGLINKALRQSTLWNHVDRILYRSCQSVDAAPLLGKFGLDRRFHSALLSQGLPRELNPQISTPEHSECLFILDTAITNGWD
jgi:hypothetical protein